MNNVNNHFVNISFGTSNNLGCSDISAATKTQQIVTCEFGDFNTEKSRS